MGRPAQSPTPPPLLLLPLLPSGSPGIIGIGIHSIGVGGGHAQLEPSRRRRAHEGVRTRRRRRLVVVVVDDDAEGREESIPGDEYDEGRRGGEEEELRRRRRERVGERGRGARGGDAPAGGATATPARGERG